jgi:UTP-glucose-1-phosphate uridylyltransferase
LTQLDIVLKLGKFSSSGFGMAKIITHAVLLAAGRGSRVSELGEKAMIRVGYPQENLKGARPEGLPIIELAFADLMLANIERVLVIRNEDSQIEATYGSRVSVPDTLRRQGRWEESMKDRLAPFLRCDYVIQPLDYKYYGTAGFGDLAREWAEGLKQFVVVECDSLLYSRDGRSPISQLVSAAQSEGNGTQAAMLVTPYPADTVHRYGIAQTERVGDRRFLRGFRESIGHPGIAAPADQVYAEYKNLTRYVMTDQLYRCVQEVLGIPPPPENNNEFQVTDGLLRFLKQGGDIVTEVVPEGCTQTELPPEISPYVDLGTYAGLYKADRRLAGLFSQRQPFWDYKLAA